MNVIEQVDYAAALIAKRNTLLNELQQMKLYVEYLRLPVMNKTQYFLKNRSASRTAMRVISNVVAGMAGIWLLFLVIRLSTDSSIPTLEDLVMVCGTASYIISFIAIIAMLLIAAVFGTMASVMRSSAYKNYLREDKQYRDQGNSMLNDYNYKMNALQQVELTLNNPSLCIIPRMYWDKVDAIAACIKSGQAKTPEEAVVKLALV